MPNEAWRVWNGVLFPPTSLKRHHSLQIQQHFHATLGTQGFFWDHLGSRRYQSFFRSLGLSSVPLWHPKKHRQWSSPLWL